MIKKNFVFLLLMIIVVAFSAGCEKTDYQNPFHRASKSK